MRQLFIDTMATEQLVDITVKVQEALKGEYHGACLVFVPHTTCGVTVNENADPTVAQDMLIALDNMVSKSLRYTHAEANSAAHAKASLVGSSVLVPVQAGRLRLGRWQGIFLCEFDGPRRRQVWVQPLAFS